MSDILYFYDNWWNLAWINECTIPIKYQIISLYNPIFQISMIETNKQITKNKPNLYKIQAIAIAKNLLGFL